LPHGDGEIASAATRAPGGSPRGLRGCGGPPRRRRGRRFDDPVLRSERGRRLFDDITALEISSSPGFPGFSGGIGFWATVKPDSSWCRSEGGDIPLLVAVDTDQNPDTGSAFYGTEVEFAFEPSGQARAGEGIFLRAAGWDFRRVSFPDGFGWGCGPDGGGYSGGAAAMGLSPTAGFNVVVATQGPHIDTAPDIGTFNYQPVSGRTPRRSALTHARLTSSRTARAPSTAGWPR
jgi:hypothetical protein